MSTENIQEVNVFLGLVEENEKMRRIVQWLGDRAHGACMVFVEQEALGIDLLVKPKRDCVPDAASAVRESALEEFLNLGCKG